jgi:hypothetical protein
MKMKYEKIVECIDWKVADLHTILLKTIPLYDNQQKDYRYYIIRTDIDNECEYTVGQKIQAELHNEILNCYSCDESKYREMIDTLLDTKIPDSIELLDWIYFAPFRQVFFSLELTGVKWSMPVQTYYLMPIESDVTNIEQYVGNEYEILIKEIKQVDNAKLIESHYKKYEVMEGDYLATLAKNLSSKKELIKQRR